MKKKFGSRRRIAGLMTITAVVLALSFVFVGSSFADGTLPWNGVNGATACSGTTTGTILWIFNPHSGATPGTLTTTWSGGGFTGSQDDSTWQQMGLGSWHLTIKIPDGDTFADLTGATLTYTGDLGNTPILTISGCNEGGNNAPPAAAPDISKTASQNTHYTWAITKAVDKTEIDTTPGTSATFHYTVTLTGTGTTGDVTGKISVLNNEGAPIQLATLSDQLSDGTPCTIDTSLDISLTIPALGTQDFPYSCGLDAPPTDAPNTTNTVTMTWNDQDLSDGSHLAAGSDFDTVPVDFTVDDNCATATDTFNGGSADPLGTYCADTGSADTSSVTLPNFNESYTAPTWTLTYDRTVPAPALGSCMTYNNEADFGDNSQSQQTGSAKASAEVCTFNAPLTIGYWGNHLAPNGTTGCTKLPNGTGCSKNGPWTSQFLPKSLGGYSVSSFSLAAAVFAANSCSNAAGSSQNAIGCLAAQLLAAELNVANISNPCINTVHDGINDANSWLSGNTVDGVPGKIYSGPGTSYTLTTAQRNEALAMKNVLVNYNQGGGC
jgi:hypothetical protein